MRRVVLVVAVLLALPRPARADLAGSVYGDVRDVIEELIRSEVTTSVVHAICSRRRRASACRARRIGSG